MNRAEATSDLPVLELANVAVSSLRSPDVTVLDQVHWTVRRGEYWVVAGLPGSGKSDLLATAAGLMRPQRGVVLVFGKEIARLPEDQRLEVQLRVAIVFGQGGRLFNHLTVAENLALPLCYHQNCVPTAMHQRVRTVLELMELTDIEDCLPMAIHRNSRQRVALARALMLSPELLFLDRPVAGLDPRESRWWLDFLDSLLQNPPILQGRQLTLVVGTDDLRPWDDHGCQFAYLANRQFFPVGGRTDMVKQKDPALRELLPLDWVRE